jgi:hypothetical protein
MGSSGRVVCTEFFHEGQPQAADMNVNRRHARIAHHHSRAGDVIDHEFELHRVLEDAFGRDT